jgi:hypothetical protein
MNFLLLFLRVLKADGCEERVNSGKSNSLHWSVKGGEERQFAAFTSVNAPKPSFQANTEICCHVRPSNTQNSFIPVNVLENMIL